ncbi:hypothetical protein GW937_00955 [Candidatus Kaiserbacteria bacterium]|nr:hypothetical protein [Candidatus Kaiserbacteria bacterium]NCT01632.1 hypothetical protein [Candidatus Parcubacteria bacterium]
MQKNDNDPIVHFAYEAIDEHEKVASTTEQQFDRTIVPLRKTVAQRFPTLFLLLVTFGFTATVTGIEHFLIKYEVLSNNPEIIFLVGIGILVLTGTLYKKLS